METKFKQECRKRGWTARVVSEKTGIPIKTIYSYYDGSRTPSSTTRRILRERLNINTGKIFD